MSLLAVENLSVAFGGVRAVDGVSFSLPAGGQIHSLIGPNGAGKTTLFNLVSGLYRPAGGRIVFGGADVTRLPPHALALRGMSRTFQNLQVFFRMTALENVMVGRHRHERRGRLAHLFALPSVARQNRETAIKAQELLAFVGLGHSAEVTAGALPYGALKRLEIARALAAEPCLLMLDEPAAGCSPAEKLEIDRLIKVVATSGITVLLVEHDMRLVMGLSDHVLVLDQGRLLAEGPPETVKSDPRVIAAYLGAGIGSRQSAVGSRQIGQQASFDAPHD